MALGEEYRKYLDDLFINMPDVSIRRMFGGAGIFREGLMFAIAGSEDGVAFKADNQNAGRFADAGAVEWVYEGGSQKPKKMGYWFAPAEILDDPEMFREWALSAFDAACRIDAAKPAGKRKRI